MKENQPLPFSSSMDQIFILAISSHTKLNFFSNYEASKIFKYMMHTGVIHKTMLTKRVGLVLDPKMPTNVYNTRKFFQPHCYRILEIP